MTDLSALNGEKPFRLSGFIGGVLELCGFTVRFYRPPWLDAKYEWLMTIQHTDDESTVLAPIEDDCGDLDQMISMLLETQSHKLPIIGMLLASSSGSHEPGVTELELIRQLKEAAIENYDWERAADLRDRERKLQR
jgi:hypothetical protein